MATLIADAVRVLRGVNMWLLNLAGVGLRLCLLIDGGEG